MCKLIYHIETQYEDLKICIYCCVVDTNININSMYHFLKSNKSKIKECDDRVHKLRCFTEYWFKSRLYCLYFIIHAEKSQVQNIFKLIFRKYYLICSIQIFFPLSKHIIYSQLHYICRLLQTSRYANDS